MWSEKCGVEFEITPNSKLFPNEERKIMTDKEIMRAAVELLCERVGKNGVTKYLADALRMVLDVDMTPDTLTERYHFNGYVEKAADAAKEYRRLYREGSKDND